MHKNVRDAVCAVVLLACAFGFLHVVKGFSEFSNKPAIGDLATWVGAIGTILAFGGTIWIATNDRRDRARREHARAVIQCTGMIDRLMQCKLHYQAARLMLNDPDIRVASLVEINSNLRRISFGDTNDLADMICLPGGAARHLSQVVTNHGALLFVATATAEYPGENIDEMLEKADILSSIIERYINAIDDVMPLIRSYLAQRNA